jgi:type II secretory pathway component PulM
MSQQRQFMTRIEGLVGSLSPRDRKLLAGLALFGSVVYVGGLWTTLYSVLDDRAGRVRDAKTQLTEALALQEQYIAAASVLRAQQGRLRQHAGTPVTAFVEKAAGEADLSDALKSVNERGKPEQVGSMSQATWTVDLAKAPLDGLVQFLYEVETSGYPIAVQSATFKASGKPGARVIDLKLDVVVYEVALDEEEPAESPAEADAGSASPSGSVPAGPVSEEAP